MDEKINEKYLKLMKEVEARVGDPEDEHIDADELLCKMLIELGYVDIVHSYNNVSKWYS